MTRQLPSLAELRPRSAMASAAPAASTHRVDGLQEPHGGSLVNLQAPKDQWDAIIKSANKTMEASDRNACDVELLSVGCVLHACALQLGNQASISTYEAC